MTPYEDLFYFYFNICMMSTVHHTKLQINGPSGHCSHLNFGNSILHLHLRGPCFHHTEATGFLVVFPCLCSRITGNHGS